MRDRWETRNFAERLGEDLSPLQVLVCAAFLYLADWAFRKSGAAFFPGGPLDEIAHFTTALLMLQWLPRQQRVKIIVPALIGSVAIDLDHIPQYLGHDFLMVHTSGRPATHSLLTVLVLLVLALALRKPRRLFFGLAVGVVLHLFRDLAEGNGGGVSLLWPLTDHSYSYPHATYAGLMACVVGVDIGLGVLSRQRTRVAAQ